MFTFIYNAKIEVSVEGSNYDVLIKAFIQSIRQLFEQYMTQALLYFGKRYMEEGVLARWIGTSGRVGSASGGKELIWKSSQGFRTTRIKSIFGWIAVPQLQVQDKVSGRKFYVTRLLLGVERRRRIPMHTLKMFSLMVSLAPYRVVRQFSQWLCGFRESLWGLRNAAIRVARGLFFGVGEGERREFEADGTGIPISSAGKRGEELKVLVQRKVSGGIRVVGLTIGRYKDALAWARLFEPLGRFIAEFREKILLVTDGDTSIFEGVREKVFVMIQRCLWHIPHEVKYTLWKDGVKRKSESWCYVLSLLIDACRVRRISEDEAILRAMIDRKRGQVREVIEFCQSRGYHHTAVFLTNAMEDMYRAIERKIGGGTISLVERAMRTINQRINVGVWGREGALAIAKIRAAYYYNGYTME